MFEYKCELYLNGSWQSYDIYNQLRFDERKDGQLKSAACYIRTEQKMRFEPMRKARVTITDTAGASSKTFYYFAYFKGQQRQRAGYWLHEVMLIDPARRAQGELIDGLRVIQNADNSVTLYDTLVRLCDTTPLRLTSQSNLYNPTTDEQIVSVMQSIRSPEYAWSCRTLFWECLKEIGMDMGGYFPTVEFGENGQYIISFFPTERRGQEITDFDCISFANGHDMAQVCSEIDTDISNIIATNQGTASVVFPSQVGWITPRTDDIQLTTDNCEIQLPSPAEKVLHIWFNIADVQITIRDDDGYAVDKNISDILGGNLLDLISYIPEEKEYNSLISYSPANWRQLSENERAEKSKNNTFYWIEDGKIILTAQFDVDDWFADYPTMEKCAFYSFIHECNGIYKLNDAGGYRWFVTDTSGKEWELWDADFVGGDDWIDMRPLQFRVEYISKSASSKIRAVKQGKCGYEYVTPYNQRAEIVDAEMLGNELDKTVNQLGVDYVKAVNVYRSFADILPIDTVYKDGDAGYMLVCNEYEATNKTNIRVTHTFSKNWSMLSEYLKQNKQYRNTRIPTDILARNLHYQDYFVISETDGLTTPLGEKGILALEGIQRMADVFNGGRVNVNSEINNFALYAKEATGLYTESGVVVSCSSFGVKKSIVFSVQMENNLTAGKRVDPENEYFVQDSLYTPDNGEFETAPIEFGIMDSGVSPNSFPFSGEASFAGLSVNVNKISTPVIKEEFYVSKSSAEQIAMTYQAHFVSDMPDIVIGGLMADNNPLVQDRTEELKYQLWGLTAPLPKAAVVVTGYGFKVTSIDGRNRSEYFAASGAENSAGDASNVLLSLYLSNKMPGDYIGWAITDEKGRLYLARNSHPNVNQNLFFNHLHKYHEQD